MSQSRDFITCVSTQGGAAAITVNDVGRKEILAITWSYMDQANPPVFAKYSNNIFQGRLIIATGIRPTDNQLLQLGVGKDTATVQAILGPSPLLDVDLSDPQGQLLFPERHSNDGLERGMPGDVISIILVPAVSWAAGAKQVTQFVGKLTVQAKETGRNSAERYTTA